MDIKTAYSEHIPYCPDFQENQTKGSENAQGKRASPLHLSSDSLMSLMARIQDYLKPEPIRWSSCTGWIIFYLFNLEGISGTLLLLYYRPTVSEAYESIQLITSTLHFGWLIRGIHIWGVHLLIIFLLLHISQKCIALRCRPRLTRCWILGVFMMTLLGIFAATGYLLPWTQTSFWETTFVTQISTALPLIGEPIKLLARGGNEISQMTLSRFFALHILIIPLLFMALTGLHIFSARRSLIPRDLLLQALILLILITALFSLTTFFPPRLIPKADPFNTYLNIKPEWYFLASYEIFQLLRFTSLGSNRAGAILGISLHVGIFLLILLLPFLVSSSENDSARNPRIDAWPKFLNLTLTFLGVLIFFILTVLGAYS